MPANHLLRNRGDDVRYIELPVLVGDLGMKKDLDHKVSQLLAQESGILPCNGVEDFVRLLEQILAEGGMGLGPVPFASPLSPEAGHDVDQPAKLVHGGFFHE
jgi:hypothetical protein